MSEYISEQKGRATVRREVIKQLTGGRLRIYLLLLTYMDHNREALVPTKVIKNDLKMSDSSISLSLRYLEEGGWIELVKKDGWIKKYLVH